jgi:hypothetical protein
VCPILTEVAFGLQNHSAIQGVYAAATAPGGGDTPTGESVDAVAAQLVAVNDNSPKVIVLATDGEPDTCEDPDAQEAGPARQEAARQLSITSVENAYASGVLTFVISVGQDVALTHLQDLANAGQGQPVGGANNVPYYVTNNQGDLSAAFLDIINNPGVRNCVFDLNVQVPPGHGQLERRRPRFGRPERMEAQFADSDRAHGHGLRGHQSGWRTRYRHLLSLRHSNRITGSHRRCRLPMQAFRTLGDGRGARAGRQSSR